MLASTFNLFPTSFPQRSSSLHALLQLLSNRSLRCIVSGSAPMMARDGIRLSTIGPTTRAQVK